MNFRMFLWLSVKNFTPLNHTSIYCKIIHYDSPPKIGDDFQLKTSITAEFKQLLLVSLDHIVDAVYCYRPSSMVVSLSVGLSVTLVSPAKTAEPIKMPFGFRTRVGPGNHVLDGGPDPSQEEAILRGKERPVVKYRDTLRSSV